MNLGLNGLLNILLLSIAIGFVYYGAQSLGQWLNEPSKGKKRTTKSKRRGYQKDDYSWWGYWDGGSFSDSSGWGSCDSGDSGSSCDSGD